MPLVAFAQTTHGASTKPTAKPSTQPAAKPAGQPAARTQAKAHTHGAATLDLGIEGKNATAQLTAPADDIIGFEHAPKTSAERAKRDSAFARLRTQGAAIVRLDPTLGCTVTSTGVGVADEHEGHGDVRATWSIACRIALAGKPIGFGLTKLFPGVQALAVQMVSDTAQAGITVRGDKGIVRP